jgi:micrococcal nuclease
MKKLIIVFFLTSLSLLAETITGKVVGVSDGDTITVLDSSLKRHKIRFEHIDAPEKSQAFGQRSKEYLSSLIFNKKVSVKIKTTDRYKRVIATVMHGTTNINLEMVKAGYAWHYKYYSKDKQFADAERTARNAKKGIWSSNKATPPWDYRRSLKNTHK